MSLRADKTGGPNFKVFVLQLRWNIRSDQAVCWSTHANDQLCSSAFSIMWQCGSVLGGKSIVLVASTKNWFGINAANAVEWRCQGVKWSDAFDKRTFLLDLPGGQYKSGQTAFSGKTVENWRDVSLCKMKKKNFSAKTVSTHAHGCYHSVFVSRSYMSLNYCVHLLINQTIYSLLKVLQ